MDAGKISVGQNAQIFVEVLPERLFSGTVTRMLHEANIQKNTLEVKVAVEDPDPKLRPEMLARVKFLAGQNLDSEKTAHRLFVPEKSVRGNAGNGQAWVVRNLDGNRGTTHLTSIKPGAYKTDGWIEVIEGLQPGDLVITSSVTELKNGKIVSVAIE
jgi:multidrug efflux pump subunit AcrA (membrane-fusion protein)